MHAPLDKQLWTTAEIDDVSILVARTNFLAFRRQIRSNMLVGWWIEEVADHLQQFYEEMMAGKRPKLAITAPPQTGKSWTVTDFIAYVAGRILSARRSLDRTQTTSASGPTSIYSAFS
jgi:hypothetical protein